MSGGWTKPGRANSIAFLAVHPFPLEHREKPFARRVVAAMADRAHAADQGVAAQKLLIRAADELPAAIRMQDHFAVAVEGDGVAELSGLTR